MEQIILIVKLESYCKARMKLCLQSVDYQIWLNVSKYPCLPIKLVNNTDELKIEDEFDEHERKKCSFSANVTNVFIVL